MAADSRALIAPSKRNRYLMEFPDLDAVLATLPLNSLFFCCTVSKSLSNLIMKDSGFANLHFVRSEPQLLIHCPPRLSYHLIDLNAGTNFAFGKWVKVKPSFNFPLRDFNVTHSSNGLVLLENTYFYNVVHQCIVLNLVTDVVDTTAEQSTAIGVDNIVDTTAMEESTADVSKVGAQAEMMIVDDSLASGEEKGDDSEDNVEKFVVVDNNNQEAVLDEAIQVKDSAAQESTAEISAAGSGSAIIPVRTSDAAQLLKSYQHTTQIHVKPKWRLPDPI
ncbi:F-box associated interaction domain-containing protein [Artemisia annua]|uniref:F-box associated interaction domain-containing protein n=1 Tax=Artemisia annua TaxID=35608 RepID=A0A2U1LCH4_ARTAN|nr:F-box associated interaction domain-containing protein [Artemisia annua]